MNIQDYNDFKAKVNNDDKYNDRGIILSLIAEYEGINKAASELINEKLADKRVIAGSEFAKLENLRKSLK